MRIQRPQLPEAPANDRFSSNLVFKTKQILTQIIDQLNPLSDGLVSASTTATTSPPTTGPHQEGDFIRNSAPTVSGAAGSQYVVIGWTCVSAGTPGTWVPCRCLTGT